MSRVHDEARDRFLATLEIARRELTVLRYSQSKLVSQPIDARWASRLNQDMDAAETLEAFVSRFGRLQDTMGARLIPRALTALLEQPASVLDNLNRAEQLGWIEDVEAWVTARELRNRLIHEYMTNAQQFAADVTAAGGFVDMFGKTYAALLRLAGDRFGVTEKQLAACMDEDSTPPEPSTSRTV